MTRDFPDLQLIARAKLLDVTVEFEIFDADQDDPPSVAHGYIKWDGCSNWDVAAYHGCRRKHLTNLGEAFARCWDWAGELIPGWIGEK